MSLAFAGVASAQQPGPEGNIVLRQRVMQGPEGGPPPPDSNFVFIASESFGGKVVKGAPYSGEAVTETIQTLSDGNRIVNRMTSSVYRDSEGRTRREQSLKGLGIFTNGDLHNRSRCRSDFHSRLTLAHCQQEHAVHI